MIKKINDDLNNYIHEHINYQLLSFQLSNDSNQKGYPGFAHFFQIEAADAFVHIRKICNYLMDNNAQIEIKDIKISNFSLNKIEETIKKLIFIKEELINFTNIFIKNARENNDYLTMKFYDWFLIDFYKEIAYEKNILNWITMSNNNLYKIDKHLLKTREPNTLKVIIPFS